MSPASQLPAIWRGARWPAGLILVVMTAIAGLRCQGCARCAAGPASPAALPTAVSPPPARDASLAPPVSAARDLWMEQRIQRILQRQRAALEVPPRAPRRPGPAGPRDLDAGGAAVTTTPAVTRDAGRLLAPPVDRAHRPDPALLGHLQRELDETRAEIARLESLAHSVRARASGASKGDPALVELGRIERELGELRALHGALAAEVAALEAR